MAIFRDPARIRGRTTQPFMQRQRNLPDYQLDYRGRTTLLHSATTMNLPDLHDTGDQTSFYKTYHLCCLAHGYEYDAIPEVEKQCKLLRMTCTKAAPLDQNVACDPESRSMDGMGSSIHRRRIHERGTHYRILHSFSGSNHPLLKPPFHLFLFHL